MILAVGLFAIASSGCSSNEFVKSKMDVALQQKIESISKSGSDSTLQFLGKCSSIINNEMEEKIKTKGVKIESIIQNTFTASGTTASIKEISNYDFITYLELARNLDLK